MITRKDIKQLITEQSLMQQEVDSRHMKLINKIYQQGIAEGKAQAKRAIQWRLNGDLWASFIDKDEYAS